MKSIEYRNWILPLRQAKSDFGLLPKEFEPGQEARAIIARRLNLKRAENEAEFIALHLVAAQLNSEMPEVMHVTRVIQTIMLQANYP